MKIVQLFCVAGVIPLATFITGYVFLRALTKRNSDECWMLSGATGCAILALIAFVVFLSGQFFLSVYFGTLLLPLSMCAGLAIAKYRKLFFLRPPKIFLHLAFLWVILVLFQCLVPVYTNAYMYGDWWMHFDISQFYMGLRPNDVTYFKGCTIPSRTPLFNLYASYFLATFKNEFWVYQMVAITSGIALICVTLLFVAKQSHRLAIALLGMNPFLVNMILFPWPKTLSATYVVLATYEYWQSERTITGGVKRSHFFATGLWLGLSILCHPSAIFYALGLAIYMFLRRIPIKSVVMKWWRMGLAIVLVVAPWLAWVLFAYGLKAFVVSSPAFASTASTPFCWLGQRFINLVGTWFPIPLVYACWSRVPFYVFNAWLRFYYAVIPGAITVTLSSVLLITFLKHRDICKSTPYKMFGALSICGFFCGVLLQPGLSNIGLVGESMTPIIVFSLILAINALSSNSFRANWLLLFVFVEFILSKGLQLVINFIDPTPKNDANLLLKEQNSLLFAWDIIYDYRYAIGGIACIVIVLIASRLLINTGCRKHSYVKRGSTDRLR